MKANELRIGNWLMSDGVPVQVDGRTIFDFWHYGENGVIPLRYEPIPLTEEWMIKLGFDTYDSEIDYIEWGRPYDGDYQKSFNGYEWIDSDGVDDNGDVFRVTSDGFYSRDELYFSYQLGDFNVRRRIHYVHQLQNLYFALTGEELQFK